MSFREFLGEVVSRVGMLTMRLGLKVTHFGFDLLGVRRDRVIEILSKMWAEDNKTSTVITHSEVLNKDSGVFIRAGTGEQR